MSKAYRVGLLLALVLTACGPSRPADDAIRELVAADIGATGDDAIVEIREFRRTDGRDAGGGRYIAQVEYDVVYLVSSQELAGRLGRELGAGAPSGDGPAAALSEQMQAFGEALGIAALRLDPFEKGEVRTKEATLTLERWETGWRLVEP